MWVIKSWQASSQTQTVKGDIGIEGRTGARGKSLPNFYRCM